MPEEKIGTKVELDITKYLGDLAKLGTAWEKYLDVLDKTYPTSEKVNDALKITTDRIKELRLSTEKLSKEEKQELTILRRRAAGLKDLADSYKKLAAAEKAGAAETAKATAETERATQKATDAIAAAHIRQQKATEATARAQEQAARKAEQAQKRQRRAAEAATRAQERQTKSVTANLKKMLLWGVGAASAYRLYRKLAIAAREFVAEVIKSTEEEARLTAANKQLRAAMAAAFGPEILDLVTRFTEALEKLTAATTKYAVQMEIGRRVRDAAITLTETQVQLTARQQMLQAQGIQIQENATAAAGRHAQMLLAQGVSAEAVVRTHAELSESLLDEESALDAVNRRMEEFIAKTEEQTEASKAAAQAYERYQQRLYRITETRLQGLLQVHKDYYDALADMALDDARRAEDLAIETARRQEDWARDAARRRAALLRQYNEQVLRAEKNYARARRRLADDRARRLLEIERRYQDRLLEIERAYSQSMYEAIAGRDATAALRAMRQRREDLADAKRDRDRARADVESDYARRLRELRENLEEQRKLARRSYEEALAELERSLREQEEDLALSLRRREEDAALSRQRQLQDLKRSLAEQMQAVQDQYRRDRALAEIEYTFREQAFIAHLQRMQLIAASYQAAFQAPPSPTGGGGVQRFAEGGAMIATGPTMALFGERGPELVIAQPLAPAPQSFMVSGSVRHEVSTIIQQSMAGFEGRIAGAVHSALSEIIR